MNLAGNINRLKKYIDVAYLIALVLYVACFACNQKASPFPFLNTIFLVSSFCLMAVAVYRLLVVMLGNSNKPLFAVVTAIAAVMLLALYILSLVNGDNTFVTVVPFALIGAMGVSADLILYACISGNLLLIIYNFFNTLFRVTDLSYLDLEPRDFFFLGDNIFYIPKFNSSSSTDFASHFFWIIAAYLWIRGKKISWGEILAIGALDILVYSMSGSNTSLLSISIVLIFAVVYKLLHSKDSTSRDKSSELNNQFGKICSQIVSFCARYSFIIIAAICIVLAVSYNTGSPLMFRLDQILHNRIAYGYRGLMEYGIHFIAEDTPAYVMYSSVDGYYFYLDCSYLSLLIRFGVLFLVFYLAGMTFIQAKYKKYTYGALILAVCALTCIEEPHLNELPYNFFILLLLADKNIDDKFVANAEKVKSNKGIILKVCSSVICIGLLIGVFFVNYPRYKAVKKLDALDQNACYIYSAVQKNVDVAIVSGEWDELIANNSSYQFGDVLSKPSDYSSVNGIAWSEAISNPKVHSYFSVAYGSGADNFAINDILISDEVKNLIGNGSVVIEYDAVSGKVYSVWYSESSGCVAIDDGRDNTRAGRLRDDVVPEGYYAGGLNG